MLAWALQARQSKIQNPPTMKCSQRFLTQYQHKLTDVPVSTFTLEAMMRTCLQSKLSRFWANQQSFCRKLILTREGKACQHGLCVKAMWASIDQLTSGELSELTEQNLISSLLSDNLIGIKAKDIEDWIRILSSDRVSFTFPISSTILAVFAINNKCPHKTYWTK